MGKKIDLIPQKVQKALINYNWPGNVRELENVIERAVIFSVGNKLEIGNWLTTKENLPIFTDKPTLNEMEKQYITSVLRDTNWRVRGKNGAAEILAMKPTTLASRMIKLNIKRPENNDIS